MLTVAMSAITKQRLLQVLELKTGTAMVKCGASSQITLSCAREGDQHTVGWRPLTMPVC